MALELFSLTKQKNYSRINYVKINVYHTSASKKSATGSACSKLCENS